MKEVNIMDEDEKMSALFRAYKDKFGHKITLTEFTKICNEWDLWCEKIRRYAGRE